MFYKTLRMLYMICADTNLLSNYKNNSGAEKSRSRKTEIGKN